MENQTDQDQLVNGEKNQSGESSSNRAYRAPVNATCRWSDDEQEFTGPHQWDDGKCSTCGTARLEISEAKFTPGPWHADAAKR